MSEEQISSLWKDIAEIKTAIKDLDKKLEVRDQQVKENCVKIAKLEQRMDNGAAVSSSSRAWVGILAAGFLTFVGWMVTIFLFLLRKGV